MYWCGYSCNHSLFCTAKMISVDLYANAHKAGVIYNIS